MGGGRGRGTILVGLIWIVALVDAMVARFGRTIWVTATLVSPHLWIGLSSFYQSGLDGKARPVRMLYSGVTASPLARIRCGVGRGNKFVLLDMTEEPEAKKLTVYNTNEI
jgi:hypothetical protein